MASIRTRTETDKLIIDFRYLGVRYRQQTTLPDTPKNRHVLSRDLRKIEAEIELGILNINKLFPAKCTGEPSFTCETARFDDFSRQWLNEKRIEWRESHFKQTKSTIENSLIPVFGISDLRNISKADVMRFRSSLSLLPGRSGNTHLSASRINHILSVLRMILNEAAERFEFKPVFINIRTIKIPKTDVSPFSISEINLILNNVNEHYKNYFTVRFFTGLRSSEINGIRWENIDFDKRQIMVREAWVNGQSVATKNDGSTREIKMSNIVYTALIEQQKITGNNNFVFSNSKNLPIDNSNLAKRVWYPLLDRLKLDRRRPYQTRHTTASLWLASCESPEWISSQLGHSTTSMLFKTYSRYVPNLTRQDGNRFEKVINNQFKNYKH